MPELLRLLKPIKNWFLLGFHLRVKIAKLQEIRDNRSLGEDEKKIQVLHAWKIGTEPSSWLDVVKALQQMKEHDLSQKIASEHGK